MIQAGNLPGRRDPKQNAGRNRGDRGEQQHGSVDADAEGDRCVVRRERQQLASAHPCQSQS